MKRLSSLPTTQLGAGLLALALLLGGCETVPGSARPEAGGASAAAEPASLGSVRTATYADNPKVFDPLDAAVAATGLDPARQAALARELLAMMQSPDVSPAVRQAAGQRLGAILPADPSESAEAFAALGAMLADDATADAARLALDPVPGAAVDEVFLRALGRATGRARLGIIQSLGARRSAAAVPALAAFMNNSDTAAAAMAVWALGRIGGAEGQAVLAQAREPSQPAVLAARLHAAAHDEAEAAVATFRAIYNDRAASAAQRAAALRGLIGRDEAASIALVKEALAGGEPAFRQAAIQAIASLPARETAREISAVLGSLDASTQVAVITALGRRGDAAAVPAIRAALGSTDAAVRLAALDALGRLPGDLDTLMRLARLAAGDGDEAKAAAAALARLDGPGLDDVIRVGAAGGEPPLRHVFLRQLAARNLAEAVPDLLGLRESPDAALRLVALEVLGDLAPPDQGAAVLDWALHATGGEQTRAIRSLINIILRDNDADKRTAAVVAAIDGGERTARLALLPVLSRTGGATALACAAGLSLGEDGAVAASAVAQLARWPDNSALDALLAAAEKAGEEKVRSDALTGATRILERGKAGERSTWPALLGRLLTLPVDQAAKDRLYYLLSLCDEPAALRLAEEQAALDGAGQAAKDAAAAVRANLMWPPIAAASENDGEAMNAVDRKNGTWWQVPAKDGVWLRLDLKISRPVRVVTLEQTGRLSRFPVEVEVCVSDDPADPGAVRATAKGAMIRTVITLPDGVRGRYLLLRHVGQRNDPEWAINEVKVE